MANYRYQVVTPMRCDQIKRICASCFHGKYFNHYYFHNLDQWPEILLYLKFYDATWELYTDKVGAWSKIGSFYDAK